MSTTVRLPDGGEVEVQTSDPKQAAAAARKHWQSKQAAPKARSGWQTAGDFLGDTIDNLVPNFGDEIAAIPDAAKAAVTGKPIRQAFDQGRREFRDHQAQYDKEHPRLAWGSTLAGAGASLAIPGGGAVRGAGVAARLLRGAATGATYGGVAGAGSGDTLSDRAKNAAHGAAGGAVLGTLAEPAGRVAAAAGRRIRMDVPGVDGAVRRLANVPRAVMRRPLVQPGQRAIEQADRIAARRMSEGNISLGMGRDGPAATPATIVSEMERRQGIGVPAMPGDTTESMRGLTSWASRGIGPGQALVKRSLDARKAQEATRVRQHVTDELGPAVDPIRAVRDINQRATAAAAPGYEAAYAQPMLVTPEIEGIMRTPAFRNATPQAFENIQNAMRDPTGMGFRIIPDTPGALPPNLPHFRAADGRLVVVDPNSLTFEAFDQVSRAMRDSGQAAMNTNGFRPRDTTNSVHINARTDDLRSELRGQNEPYRDVTDMYADEMAIREALEAGQDVGKLSGHEINAQFGDMGPPRRGQPQPSTNRDIVPSDGPTAPQPSPPAPQQHAREAWITGARTSLADAASDFGAKFPTGDTAAMVRKLLGDDTKQAAIGRMADRPGAIPRLQGRLEAEHQGNILWKDVHGNSKTAPRQQLDADLDDAAGARPLSSLTARGVLTSVIDNVAARASTQFRNDVKARVAQIVTETNPATVRELMAEIADRARRDTDFAHLLHRSGIITGKAAGMNVAPPNPDEARE